MGRVTTTRRASGCETSRSRRTARRVVISIGHGAVMPVLALRARDLGADVGTAALVVGLLGVGMLLASLPAGARGRPDRARRGRCWSRALLDAVAMVAAALTDSVVGAGRRRSW